MQGEEPNTGRCGVQRWAVKTLADAAATEIDFTDIRTLSVSQLRQLPLPQQGVGSSRGRLRPYEYLAVRTEVGLVSAKREEDSDIHLVVSQPGANDKTMIVELPAPYCLGPVMEAEMTAARRSFLASCGPISASDFTRLSGSAVITGVIFFDVIHGQTGVAPNGVEIHPVTRFEGNC